MERGHVLGPAAELELVADLEGVGASPGGGVGSPEKRDVVGLAAAGDANRVLDDLDGLVVRSDLLVRQGDRPERIGRVGIHVQRPAELRDGLLESAGGEKGPADVGLDVGGQRLELAASRACPRPSSGRPQNETWIESQDRGAADSGARAIARRSSVSSRSEVPAEVVLDEGARRRGRPPSRRRAPGPSRRRRASGRRRPASRCLRRNRRCSRNPPGRCKPPYTAGRARSPSRTRRSPPGAAAIEEVAALQIVVVRLDVLGPAGARRGLLGRAGAARSRSRRSTRAISSWIAKTSSISRSYRSDQRW